MSEPKRNFVPNSNKEERTIGTLLKKWLKGFFYDLSIEHNLTDETNSVTVAQIKNASDHTSLTNNPHTVTKTQVSLGNVDNTSDVNKPVSSATQTALNLKVDRITGKGLSTEDYTTTEKGKLAGIETNANNYIHPLTHPATMIVEDSTHRFFSDTERTKLGGVESGAQVNVVTSVAGKTGALTLAKGDVGLSNVDNTSDANKPVSSAAQTALNAKADLVNGTVPANQLPSFVDDVLEFANLAALPTTGEIGKIYVTLDTNETYRWSGTIYIRIANGAVQSVNSRTGNITLTKADVTLNNVPNVDATSPSNISQDATHRFVSDTEKSTWNAKQDALGFTAVPNTRTVNGKALNSDISLTPSDIGLSNVPNTDPTAAIASGLKFEAFFNFVINGILDLTTSALNIDFNQTILKLDLGAK